MTTSAAKSGFRIPATMWRRYAAIVGNAGRSEDIRRYLEWRIDNPELVLGRDPGAAGAEARKFRVHEDLWKLYCDVFADDLGISADLRTYVAWRIAHPAQPLPGNTRVSLRRDRSVAA